jgi:hypothetical protein
MFVAMVVPWKTWSSASGSTPASAHSSVMPLTVPSDGSAGVDGVLWTITVPASSST